jgi:hypothetical protein
MTQTPVPALPTVNSIRFKFNPAFNQIDDASIEFALEEAIMTCDSTEWIDDLNHVLAIMYYCAHLLQVSIMRAASATGQVVESERTPDLSVSYAVPNQNTPIDFTMTIYGERFLGLARKNMPPVAVVNSAVRF